MKKLLALGGGLVVAVLVLFGLIQLVPYGRDHANPPVRTEVKWDSPQTRTLAERACEASPVGMAWCGRVSPAGALVGPVPAWTASMCSRRNWKTSSRT